MAQETLTAPSPEQMLAEKKHIAKGFLSHAKELVHNHGRGIEPMQTVFGHDVLPQGIVQTPITNVTIDGESRRFRLAAEFKKTKAESLSGHLESITIEEIKGNLTENVLKVEADHKLAQYGDVLPDEKALPSLKKLQEGAQLLERMRQNYTQQR